MLPLSLCIQEINLIFPFELCCSLCFLWLCQDRRVEAETTPCFQSSPTPPGSRPLLVSHQVLQNGLLKTPRPNSGNPRRDLHQIILLSTTWGAVVSSLLANPQSAGRNWRNIGGTQGVVSPVPNTSASRPVFLCNRTGLLPTNCLLPLWF